MSWLSTLTEKPWLAQEATNGVPHCIHDQQLKRTKTALYFMLAVIGVVFFLFTITLLQRSQSFDFQPLAGEIWRPLTDTQLLWQNTMMLFLASVMLFIANWQAKREHHNTAMVFVTLSTFFSLWFIHGQVAVWQHLLQQGYYLTSNPANSYFYVLTGLHVLHIAIGLLVMLRVFIHYFRPATPQSLRNFIQLTGIYWHYLLVIWLGLFALLTSDSETFATVAAWCGF